MKNVLLIGCLLLSFCVQAQFTTGEKFLGGTLSFSSQDSPWFQNSGGSVKTTSFTITPAIGFLLSDHFALGGRLGYSSSRNEYEYDSDTDFESDSKSFQVGVFGQRYYELSDKFLFSLMGQLNFRRGYTTEAFFDITSGQVSEIKTKAYGLEASIRPVFIFFPSPKWGLEAGFGSLSYSITRNLTDEGKGNSFGFDYGTITFGLAYYFRKSGE